MTKQPFVLLLIDRRQDRAAAGGSSTGLSPPPMLMAGRTLGLNLNYARVSLSDTEAATRCQRVPLHGLYRSFPMTESHGAPVARLIRTVCTRFAFYNSRQGRVFFVKVQDIYCYFKQYGPFVRP